MPRTHPLQCLADLRAWTYPFGPPVVHGPCLTLPLALGILGPAVVSSRLVSRSNSAELGKRSGQKAEQKNPTTEKQEPSTTEQTTVSETTVPAAEVTESTSAAEGTSGSTSESSRMLEDKWYIDSDGNEVPDFVETELGYDPKADDCAKEVNYPGPSGVSGTSAADFVSKEQNTMLILGSSGSMAEPIGGGQTKMAAAKESLERYATATPDFINLGFAAYGHEGSNAESDKAESCEGVEVLEQPGEVNYQTFPDTLQSFQLTGWTPIAGALREAGETFSGKSEATNRVILVSDGLETCGGDPVAAARELADSDIQVTIDVVGFDITQSEEEQLRRIAEVSGGNYATAGNAEELQDYFDEQAEVYYELIGQYVCVSNASSGLYVCNTNVGNEANGHIVEIGNEVASNSGDDSAERSEAIYEIAERAYDYNWRIAEEGYKQSEKRIKEINKDINQVEQRMQERYNEDVSYAPSCPGSTVYANLEKEDMPGSVAFALLTSGLSGSNGP